MLHSGFRRTKVLALATVLAFSLAACGDDGDDDDAGQAPPTTQATPQGSSMVTIDMVDHAFQVSGPLTAGGTIRMVNKGAEFHMVAFGKFKPGKTMTDLQRVLSEAGPPGGGAGGAPSTTAATGAGQATTTTTRPATTTSTSRASGTTSTTAAPEEEDPTAEIIDELGLPGAFMGPGEAVEITVPNLEVGTYALLCFIPSEGDGAPHFVKGMVNQLEVVAGPAPAAPTADATYKIAPAKAIEGPATLTPGKHTLKFEVAAGSQDLEPGLARLNAGTTFQQLDTALSQLFEGDQPPARGVATRVPGQVVFGGFDLGSVTTFYLTVDLKAGNYTMVAEDTDIDDTPGLPKELINIRVA